MDVLYTIVVDELQADELERNKEMAFFIYYAQ